MATNHTNQDLLPGHVVYINVYNDFFEIGEVEPFQYDTGQESTAIFSAVADGGQSDFVNVLQMEPDDKPNRHLFQAMVGCQYEFQYFFKIPTGTNRFGTDVTKGIGFLDSTISPYFSPNKDFQMWFVNDYYPAVNAKHNIAGTETITPRLRFLGFKYLLKDIPETKKEMLRNGQKPFTYIGIGGLRC